MDSRVYHGRIGVSADWDVVVVGGGPGGCAAAVAAARAGAKTLLLEGTGAAGGMGTGGLVPAWCPFSDGEKIFYRGIAETVFRRAKAGLRHVDEKLLNWVSIDPEALKRTYDELLMEHGVSVLFHTFVAGVEMAGDGTIDAVIAGNKAGLTAFRAKVFVDGTGDGDIAAWAGADFSLGDDRTGALQHATLCFTLSNVDSYYYQNACRLHGNNPGSPVHRIAKDDSYPEIFDTHLCQTFTGPGTVGFNAGHLVGVDSTDPAAVSAAMIQGRRIAHAYLRALKEYEPEAFGAAHLVCTANLMGIREGRRIAGDYELTCGDYLARRSFEDEIGRNSYYLDIHGMSGEMRAVIDKAGRYKAGESHGIPFGSLLPKKLDNLLLCGRCISADRMTYGSVRVMPVCLVTGEAAGTAAAMAVQREIAPRELDRSALRGELRKNGAYFL